MGSPRRSGGPEGEPAGDAIDPHVQSDPVVYII